MGPVRFELQIFSPSLSFVFFKLLFICHLSLTLLIFFLFFSLYKPGALDRHLLRFLQWIIFCLLTHQALTAMRLKLCMFLFYRSGSWGMVGLPHSRTGKDVCSWVCGACFIFTFGPHTPVTSSGGCDEVWIFFQMASNSIIRDPIFPPLTRDAAFILKHIFI